MKKIKVVIEGDSPLLMNNPISMLEKVEGVFKTTAKRNVEEEVEKLAYRKANKELYVPSSAIKGTIINASSYKKAGKHSLRPIIAGGVRIEPEELGLGIKKYDVDKRTAVIMKARIVKCRPRIEHWKLNFDIIYDETMIADDLIVKQCLEEAGKRVGILDFRPQKSGSFGTFHIIEWKTNGNN